MPVLVTFVAVVTEQHKGGKAYFGLVPVDFSPSWWERHGCWSISLCSVKNMWHSFHGA